MPNDNLATLVQGLPAELFDEIYNLTFTASPNQPREVDDQYKPPHLLRIDRKSRTLFATSYYGNDSIFYIPYELLGRFFNSIPKAHCAQIANVRTLDKSPPFFARASGMEALVQSAYLLSFSSIARDIPGHPTSGKDVLNVKVERGDGSGVVGWKKLSDII